MSKELWIEEYDRIVSELTEQGYPQETAENIAEHTALIAVRERLSDVADNARMRAKDGRADASKS